MSSDSAKSPSSPRKRQLGFIPKQGSSSKTFKVEKDIDNDSMDDLWGNLDTVDNTDIGETSQHMDYDELLGVDSLPDLTMPSLTTSNQSESICDFPAVPSSISAKTTPESSNMFIVSPAASSQYESCPINSESLLKVPVSNLHSTESIAQMLEYMRACNSQDAPPPPPPLPLPPPLLPLSENSLGEDSKEEQERIGRKKEKITNKNTTKHHRKQLSPTQKMTRSFSHGSDNIHRPSIGALQQRARQRSKIANGVHAAASIAIAAEGEDSNALHIDTGSAVQAIGPSGATRQTMSSNTYPRHYRHPVSADNEPWSALESPIVPSWSGQSDVSISQGNQQQQQTPGENLSFNEFLKRPEGAMWLQHFQKNQQSESLQDYPTPAPFTVHQQQQQQQQPPAPTLPLASTSTFLAPLTPSITAHLPPPIDVANMLGMQQAPNQALVQAFQTAFVLGMQQLGMAGHFQTIAQPVSEPYAYPWPTSSLHQQLPPAQAPQQHQHSSSNLVFNSPLAQKNHEQGSIPMNSVSSSSSTSIDQGKSSDASSVLQALLHDINQHRPDKQEFSLDEFLAFVASTVESTSDEQVQQGEEMRALKMPDGKTSREASTSRKTRKTVESGSGVSPIEKHKSSTTISSGGGGRGGRRRTISISGQLSGTYLDDVAEDNSIDVNKGDEVSDDYHHKVDTKESAEINSRQRIHRRHQSHGEKKQDVEIEQKSEESIRTQRDSLSNSIKMDNSNGGSGSNGSTKTAKEKEALKLVERRRRRRESHNAVERRRRDHINERIAELASLLPESMLLDAIAASTSGGTMPHIDLSLFAKRPAATATAQGHDPAASFDNLLDDSTHLASAASSLGSHHDLESKANALEPVHSSSETLALAQSKPNKGIILSKIVEYIKHLHEFCSVLRTKNTELQADLNRKNSLLKMESTTMSYHSSAMEDSTMATATPPSVLTHRIE